MIGAVGVYTNGSMLYNANCKGCDHAKESKKGYYCKVLKKYGDRLRRCPAYKPKQKKKETFPVRHGWIQKDGSILWDDETVEE